MGLDFLQLINPVWAEKGGASTEERQKEIEGVRMDIGGGGPGWDMMRTRDQNLGFKLLSVLNLVQIQGMFTQQQSTKKWKSFS